jgi:DNA-binding transcriptional regulator YbjK
MPSRPAVRSVRTSAGPGGRAARASAGRRGELLAAGVLVLAESGLRGLTHRAVDARAGLPEGTCSAYFRTRSSLLVALAEHVGGALEADVDTMAASLPPHGDDPDDDPARVAAVSDAVRDLLVGWLGRPEVVRAQAELALEAARHPELMSVFDRWRAGLLRIVAGIEGGPGRGGHPHRAGVAVAALEGVLVTAVRMPRAEREPFVREAVPTLVSGLHSSD